MFVATTWCVFEKCLPSGGHFFTNSIQSEKLPAFVPHKDLAGLNGTYISDGQHNKKYWGQGAFSESRAMLCLCLAIELFLVLHLRDRTGLSRTSPLGRVLPDCHKSQWRTARAQAPLYHSLIIVCLETLCVQSHLPKSRLVVVA